MSAFRVEYKNPEGLFSSKAFSQAITVRADKARELPVIIDTAVCFRLK
ncbi:hypothetical protein ACOBQJ_15530 [Pelotomaculum propionicicum]